MDRITFIIAESIPIVRWALSRLVEEQPNATVIRETDSCHKLLTPHRALSYEVLIARKADFMQLTTPQQQQLKQQGALLIGTTDAHTQPVTPAFFAYIDLSTPIAHAQKVVKLAINEIAKHRTDSPNGNILSEREIEILKDIALGLSAKEIAAKNFISPYTVNTHRKNITRKLGIKTTSGLTIYAVLNKHIRIEEVG